MAKAKKKKSSSPVNWSRKIIDWADRHRFKSVLVIAVIVLTGWLIVSAVNNHIKTAHERAQFAQAKTDLDAIYANIVASVGEPNQHQASQSCGYTSTDFGDGFRSCTLEQSFAYPSASRDGAIKKAAAIEGVVESYRATANTRSIDETSGPSSNILTKNFKLADIKHCISDYWFVNSDNSEGIPNNLIFGGSPLLTVHIYCSQSARAEYYRLVTTKTGAPVY